MLYLYCMQIGNCSVLWNESQRVKMKISSDILDPVSTPYPRVLLGHPQPLEDRPRHQSDHGPPVLACHAQEPPENLDMESVDKCTQ